MTNEKTQFFDLQKDSHEEPSGWVLGHLIGGWLLMSFLFTASFALGWALAIGETGHPLVWPASGLALVMAFRWGKSAVLGIALGAALVSGIAYDSALIGFGFGIGHGGTAFIAADLLKRWNTRTALESLKDVLQFILIGALAAPIWCALCVGVVFSLQEGAGWIPSGALFGQWWLADSLGTLVLAPLIFVWSSKTRINWHNRQWAEVLGWLVVLVYIESFTFLNWVPIETLRYPLEFAIFPLVIWSAIRFGQRGATVSGLITALIAAYAMSMADTPLSQPLYLWVFVGVVSATAMCLAAVFTEYRNREEELRLNEERLRAFVRAIPDLAFVISREGSYLDVFAPRASVFCERARMLKGRKLQDIYPQSLQKQFLEVINEVLDTGEVRVWRYVMDFHGKPHWFEGRVAPMEQIEGNPQSVFWVAYDITESQLVNQALRERDRLLQSLTEAEAVLLRTLDYKSGVLNSLEIIGKGVELDRIEVFFNEESVDGHYLRSHFEWNARSVSGPEGASVVDSPRLRIAQSEFLGPWASLSGGTCWNMRARSDLPAKVNACVPRNLPVNTLWVPFFVEDNFSGAIAFSTFKEHGEWTDNVRTALVSMAGSLGGFVETKRIEDALKEAKRHADKANNAKGEFLAMMSHEIRTPMNAIIGFTDLLLHSELDEQQNEYASIIDRGGKDLLDLINHILDFSKLESGPIELEKTPFNLETTVMEVLEIMLMKARQRGISLDCDYAENCEKDYIGDPLRVRQILLNLVSNAIKFTPVGGVVVSVRSKVISAEEVCIQFSVKDTGIGIPPEKIDDLFKAFTQLDSSTTREYGGTGLGLAICQNLAEKMSGRMWAESVEGEGSVFNVELILERQNEFVPEVFETRDVVSPDQKFADQHPLKILLAEDDPRNTLLAKEILSRLGYTAVCVDDGLAAATELARAPYDVVLLDVHMAQLDGISMAKRLRSGEFGEINRYVVLVALTASVLAEDQKRCFDAGMNAFLGKPFSMSDLTKALENAYNEMMLG